MLFCWKGNSRWNWFLKLKSQPNEWKICYKNILFFFFVFKQVIKIVHFIDSNQFIFYFQWARFKCSSNTSFDSATRFSSFTKKFSTWNNNNNQNQRRKTIEKRSLFVYWLCFVGDWDVFTRKSLIKINNPKNEKVNKKKKLFDQRKEKKLLSFELHKQNRFNFCCCCFLSFVRSIFLQFLS